MKVYKFFTLIAAALLIHVAGAADHNDVHSKNSSIDIFTALKMFAKAFHGIMPCGYAPLHIPVLAPVSVNHYKLHFSNSCFSIAGNVTNFWIYGLDFIRVLGGDYNTDTNSLSFDIIFPEIQALGEYEAVETAYLPGLHLTFAGKGVINKKVTDLRFIGELVLENPDSLKVTGFILNFGVGNIITNNWNDLVDDAVNNFVNKFTSELGLLWVQQIQKYLDNIYAEFLLPKINDKLKHLSMNKLIDMLVSQAMEFEMADC